MKILDRYFVLELVAPLFFGVAAFTSIILGSSVLFPLISSAVRYGISGPLVVKILIYRIPSILSVTFPMSMLLAAIISFGRMSSDGEVTALKAAGINLYRVLVPVVFLGLSVSVLNVLFNELVVPRATHSAEMLTDSLKGVRPKIQQNVNVTEYDSAGFPARIINVREVDGFQLSDATVAEFDRGQLARLIRAKTGHWDPQGAWDFYDGVMHSFAENSPDEVTVIRYKHESIDIKLNLQEAAGREKGAQEMSARELRSHIAFKARTGADVTSDRVNYHMKFSLPFACLVFSIIGVTMGIRPNRSSGAMGFGLSILIILIYYILYSLGMGLGLAKILPPFWAAWLPNLIAGFVGFFMLRRLAYQ